MTIFYTPSQTEPKFSEMAENNVLKVVHLERVGGKGVVISDCQGSVTELLKR